MSNAIKAYYDTNRRLLSLRAAFPMTVTQTLLGVAMWNPDRIGAELPLEELAFMLGIVPQTLSTHLDFLGETYRCRPGLGLVSTMEHSASGRAKSFRLTPTGAALIRELEATLRRR